MPFQKKIYVAAYVKKSELNIDSYPTLSDFSLGVQ